MHMFSEGGHTGSLTRGAAMANMGSKQRMVEKRVFGRMFSNSQACFFLVIRFVPSEDQRVFLSMCTLNQAGFLKRWRLRQFVFQLPLNMPIT